MSFRLSLPPYPPTPGCYAIASPTYVPARAYPSKIHQATAALPQLGAATIDNHNKMLPTMLLPSLPQSLLLLPPSLGFVPTMHEAHKNDAYFNQHSGMAEDDRRAGDSQSPYPDDASYGYGSPSPAAHTSAPSSPVCASSVPASPSLLSPPSLAPKNECEDEDDEDLSAHEILRRLYLLKMRHAASLALLNTGGEGKEEEEEVAEKPGRRSPSSSPTKRRRGSEGYDSGNSQTGRKKRARMEDSRDVGKRQLDCDTRSDGAVATGNDEQSVDRDLRKQTDDAVDADGLYGYIIDDEEEEEDEMSDSDYDEDGIRQQSSSSRTTRKQESAPSSPERPAHPWPSRRRKNRKKGTKRHAPRVMTGRTCMHCNATSTPEWRTGPQGKGTLCNACGLRWKKTGQW